MGYMFNFEVEPGNTVHYFQDVNTFTQSKTCKGQDKNVTNAFNILYFFTINLIAKVLKLVVF